MRCLHAVSIALLGFALTACGVVTVESPVGDDSVQLDRSEWEGTWVMFGPDGASFYVSVLDGEKGILEARWINHFDAPDTIEKWTGYLRDVGDKIIFSATDDPEAKPPFILGMLIRNEAQATILLADVDKFEALVEEGKLPGKEGTESVNLGHLEPEHIELIVSDKEGFLFETYDPLIVTRVAWSR